MMQCARWWRVTPAAYWMCSKSYICVTTPAQPFHDMLATCQTNQNLWVSPNALMPYWMHSMHGQVDHDLSWPCLQSNWKRDDQLSYKMTSRHLQGARDHLPCWPSWEAQNLRSLFVVQGSPCLGHHIHHSVFSSRNAMSTINYKWKSHDAICKSTWTSLILPQKLILNSWSSCMTIICVLIFHTIHHRW